MMIQNFSGSYHRFETRCQTARLLALDDRHVDYQRQETHRQRQSDHFSPQGSLFFTLAFSPLSLMLTMALSCQGQSGDHKVTRRW
jgi:hypothetical protein